MSLRWGFGENRQSTLVEFSLREIHGDLNVLQVEEWDLDVDRAQDDARPLRRWSSPNTGQARERKRRFVWKGSQIAEDLKGVLGPGRGEDRKEEEPGRGEQRPDLVEALVVSRAHDERSVLRFESFLDELEGALQRGVMAGASRIEDDEGARVHDELGAVEGGKALRMREEPQLHRELHHLGRARSCEE